MEPEDQTTRRRPAETIIERRREQRYPIEAQVIVRRQNGEVLSAQAVDISASGMRVYVPPASCPLTLDEEVTVEVELRDRPDKPFSAWGLGRVVYIDDSGTGIQLYGGHFDPLRFAEDET
ncbi:MAG TPA: PilZ domain-containing protein [Bryobacteraceae bacterium]|nr:PilZ domain-containing protein [Bryobacteraceae bacterium]